MRLLFMLALCAPASGNAQTAPSWDLPQLMHSLAQVKEAKATFVESKFLKVLKKPLESSGTLIFQAPDHLEKHTLVPKKESLILDQGVLRIDSPSRNMKRTLVLQDYPAIWAFVESIRSTLAGDLETLQQFYKIELTGDPAHWRMRLHPIDPRMREVIQEIRLNGHDNWIDSIETREANGDQTLMKVVRNDNP